VRNITKTLAVVSLLAPASAQPLGIGDIKLHSALNQKLNAEIDLVVSADESASDIQVRLASPEKFDEAGVPWSYFLSQIKFNTVVQSNGAVVVKVSSNEALREPFLDFLLEVSWDKGNLYREFTVLIDPPAAYEQPVIPVTKKVKQPEQEVVNNRVADKVAPVAAVSKPGVSTYGPTKRADTLWKIAEKVMPSDDISIEQMMMAIFEANHRAFYRNNVNALMSGRTLKIPDNEAILKLSKKQAAKLFKRQADAWKAKVKRARAEKAAVTDEHVDNQLELAAPVESDVSDNVAISSELEQGTDASIIKESNKTADQSVTDSEIEGKTTEQVTHDADMQVRLQKLEQQLIMMQKLLTLKDEQLAALQNQYKTTEGEKVKTITESQTAVKTVKPMQKTEVKPKSQFVVKPKAKPDLVPAAEPATGFFTQTYYLVVGGLGVALLGALGWLWWRKRKVEEQTDTESMFASSSEIRMPDSETDFSVTAVGDGSAYDVGTVGESSFLSEFTPSDFDAFDTDQNEVDPISEADVYLAYGRYQQAEELIRQAIEDQPERNECKLKLLEIFYANENRKAFEQYTHELVQAGMHNDQSFWAKVQEMAKEIIPDAEILTDAKPEKAAFESEIGDSEKPEQQLEPKTRSGEDAEFNETDLDEINAEMSSLESGEDSSDNLDLDFDLSDFPDVDVADEVEQSTTEEQLESFEFDLDSFSKAESETASEAMAVSDNGEDIESIDFDFSDKTADKEVEIDTAKLNPDIDDNVEESLEKIDFSSMNELADIKDEAIEDNAPENEGGDFDFNFDFDDASLSVEDRSSEEQDGVSDLTDMNEFETKIDLAKAYIDMGDIESAKTIVEEVLEKGNGQQKQTAQALLDDLR